MEELQPENFVLIKLADGSVCTADDGSLCVQRKSDGNIFFVQPSEELLEAFDCVREPRQDVQDSQKQKQMTLAKRKWTRAAILALIKERIAMDKTFKSTNTKSDENWKQLASKLNEQGFDMNASQCSDKWRYLKSKYTQKKDNMGAKGTGEPPYEFEYFEELDSFLGQKHQITPVAIASSSQGNTIPEQANEFGNDLETGRALEEPAAKKQKGKSKLTVIKDNQNPRDKLLSELKERESNRERRHQQTLEARNRAIDVFSMKMDRLLDKLDN